MRPQVRILIHGRYQSFRPYVANRLSQFNYSDSLIITRWYGQPKESRYASWGNLQTLPLKSKPSLQPGAIALLKTEDEQRKCLYQMQPLSMDQVDIVAKQGCPSSEDLQKEIVPRERSKGHGCLAQYAQAPDGTNAAHDENFRRLFLALFGKTDRFQFKKERKKRSEIFKTLVMDHQLFLLKQRYQLLTDYCITHGPSRRANARVPWFHYPCMFPIRIHKIPPFMNKFATIKHRKPWPHAYK